MSRKFSKTFATDKFGQQCLFVVTQFTTLDNSHVRYVLLFWLPEKCNRTNVTRNTNDVYELSTHVDTSNA